MNHIFSRVIERSLKAEIADPSTILNGTTNLPLFI